MGVLTEEQLKKVWYEQGMKYNVQRFHKYLLERGLLPYIDVNKFSTHMYELLERFMVLGMKEEINGKQRFPAQADGSWEVERNRKSKESSETAGRRSSGGENT